MTQAILEKQKIIESENEEEEILKEIRQEISHHDIFSFKLENQSLKTILSKTKPFEKKFFHFQRYNFNLQELSPDLCSFYDIILQDKDNKNIINNINDTNKINDDNLIDIEGKRKKINEVLSDNNVKISEVLENIMEDVNIFDKIYQEEKDKIENEEIKIDVEKDISNSQLKYMYFQQVKEKEKIKLKNNQIIPEKEVKNRIDPIEMIDKIENDYNNKIVKAKVEKTKVKDLYPLDTYKKNNELKVPLLLEDKKNSQFEKLKEIMLIKEITNSNIPEPNEDDIFSTFIIDKPYQEPGNFESIFIYVGTNKGKIVKLLLNNRKSKNNNDIIREEFDTKEDRINSIDIYENYMITGHQNGSILFWNNKMIFDKTQNIDQNRKTIDSIIYLKIIKIIPKKEKIEIIYSDKTGKVFYLKRIKGLFKYSETKELLINDDGFPTYKISFFSTQKDLKKAKKKIILFALTSPKGISLLKIPPKGMAKDEINNQYVLKFISSPKGKIDKGIFDSSFGFGFPPMTDKSKRNSVRGSISDSIVIGKNEVENLLFAVSFGEIINLYDVKYSRSNKLYMNPIGHFINDKPIINISFLTKSYIVIITSDFFLKVINTFDFDNNQYKKDHPPTKNSLLLYEPIDLKKLIMMRQTNIITYNDSGKEYTNYYIYLNTVATLNKSIVILGRKNFYQYTLLQWDAIIQSLDRAKEYEKMLWLAMVVFNNNKNLLTIQSNNTNENFIMSNQYQICSPIISKYLIQVVIPEIEKNNNFNPIIMLIEFCIGAELKECLYESILTLKQKGYDKYLYDFLTLYILNNKCQNIDFQELFLLSYIKYYVDIREKITLSESLLNLNILTLIEQKLVLSAIEECKIINTAIYTKIKDIKKGEIDYFTPIQYLFCLFKKDFYSDKENKLFETESEKEIKDKYYKLITENDNNLYIEDNEDFCTYYEFIGHKILWYCNKCLSREEFHTNNKISKNKFEKVGKKIIVFLTEKEVMKIFLEFDSYSYFQIINRFFVESELFELIHREIESNKDLFDDIPNFIEEFLGNKIKSRFLTDKYFFYEIKDKCENFKNIFVKYDYYNMIPIICKNNKEFHLDKTSIKNSISFFINYFEELNKSSSIDKYSCHKQIDNIDDYNKKLEEIESDLIIMIKSIESNNELIREDIDEILSIKNIKLFQKTRIYLYEASYQYEECFQLYKEKVEEENNNLLKAERIKELFKWINKILQYTKDKEKDYETEVYHQKFKDCLLYNFNYLSILSLNEISNLADNWFLGEEDKIISKLNDSNSQSLQFKYINYYLATHEYNPSQNNENCSYYKFLLMKINLLIKANHREQVLNVLHHNNFLCKENLLKDLLSKEIYDACIYIYHVLNKLDEGINLTKNEMKKTLNEIFDEITSKKYNSINIDNMINKYKKYVELGLGICQKSEIMRKREIDLVDDYWLLLINIIYTFQMDFTPLFNKNKNNYKTADYIKINNALNETFDSSIAKMTDCISLPLIMDVMAEKCGEAGFTKFKQLNLMMFSNFRLKENIFNHMKNLIESGVSLEVDNYLHERNRGHIANFITCALCNKFLGSSHIDNLKYFSCNHVYHKLCFLKEGEEECPICKKNDCIINKNESNFFKEMDEDKKNDIIEEMRKTEEELNKKNIRRNRLIKLKKINKKKREINKVFNNDLFP